jgi:hypothetical protein
MRRLMLWLNLAVAGFYLCSCQQHTQTGKGMFLAVQPADSHISFSNNLEPGAALGILQ